jgi:glycerol-3-phosphate dehydrogenase
MRFSRGRAEIARLEPVRRARHAASGAIRAGERMADFDVAVIGGGINGVGIARDAAGRGLKVLLVEQGDLAAGTSAASTKLIHGGLRYLEQREFSLVRASLAEREVLLHAAPHLVRPMRFVLPVGDDGRPPWLIRLGLLVYDAFAWRGSLPRTRSLTLNTDPAGAPLRRSFAAAFEYSDCTVDDSRLVIANAMDAAARGAIIRLHTRCIRVERSAEWTLVLNARGRRTIATARVLVNTTGPWTLEFNEFVLRASKKPPVRLVKGSHIVVPRLFDHGRAYLFQNHDGRIVFAIPFHHDFTLIGTTDTDFSGDLGALAPTHAEIVYLCDAVNEYFRNTVSPGDVVCAFAGVRPLYDDGRDKAQEVTREHVLELDSGFRRAPLLTLYGGKLTTYRVVADQAVDKIASFFTPGPPWTAKARLPGGDLAGLTIAQFTADVRREWPFLSELQADRLAGAYGSNIERILGPARRCEDLGQDFGAGLTAAEVVYLMRHEWAETADDVLWRRSKLGLLLGRPQKETLAQFMAGAAGAP